MNTWFYELDRRMYVIINERNVPLLMQVLFVNMKLSVKDNTQSSVVLHM